MYWEVNYQTNKGLEIYGILIQICLYRIGFYSLFDVYPCDTEKLKKGWIKIYGEADYVDSISRELENVIDNQKNTNYKLVKI